jgi:hypothetical protein
MTALGRALWPARMVLLDEPSWTSETSEIFDIVQTNEKESDVLLAERTRRSSGTRITATSWRTGGRPEGMRRS